MTGITISNAGSGYSPHNLPLLTCAGGTAGVFTAILAGSGHVFTPSFASVGTGYANGIPAVADCTGVSGCTGVGFAGTCDAGGIASIAIGAGGTGYVNKITSITISGAGTGYTNGGALSVTSCTGGCTGTGLAGTCTVVAGAVTSISITNPGSGYIASAPPTIACAGGSGHTFTPTIDTSFYTPVLVREDASVDFSGDGVGHIGGVSALIDDWPWRGSTRLSSTSMVYANARFAARWNGLIEPLNNQTYTFSLMLNGVTERVRMWLDHSLLIDQWQSLSSLYPTATHQFTRDFTFYDITIEYQQRAEHSSRMLKLLDEGIGDSNSSRSGGHRAC